MGISLFTLYILLEISMHLILYAFYAELKIKNYFYISGFLLLQQIKLSRYANTLNNRIPVASNSLNSRKILIYFMKIIRFWSLSTTLLYFLLIQGVLAETDKFRFAFIGDSGNSAYLGAKQGLDEANLQGRFLNQNYTMDIINSEDALTTDYSDYIAVIAAVDRETFQRLSDHLPDKPVFNVWLDDDALRTQCRPNSLHIVPSRQMKQDAIAQWHKLHPDVVVVAQTWHPDYVKFAARDLNKRFAKTHEVKMDDAAWAGWAAVKMSSDTIARQKITGSEKLLSYLKTSLVFDGQMGVDMNFRDTGQLRQPLLLVADGKITGEAPVRGVSDNLDSLGNTECDK